MALLFSSEGHRRLDDFARHGLLCAFDFDGTLAPLVPMPEQASLPEEIRERLVELTDYAPVAIITGRSVPDICDRLRFDPDFVVGNHGLEGVPGWEEHSEQHRALCAGWMRQLQRALDDMSHASGIQIEDKRYSISVHYRQARDPAQASRALERLFHTLSPVPRIIDGKFVFNLLPEDGADKGIALERLMQSCGAHRAIYVGDDVTDEDVFALQRPDVLSVRIEHHEASAADFHLEKPQDILQLLEEIRNRLHAAGSRNWVRSKESKSA
ncbi:MAG TPA: trehalose-phosphatase [Noviherbaspirillum sp.]